MTVLLSVEQITKTYPGVKALQEVSFSVEAATVHAIMGENGAGKSTLMQVIAGAHSPTSGRLIFDGQEVEFTGTRDAAKKGISIVFQELMLAPNMTIAENIFLGTEPRMARVLVDRGTLLEKAKAAMLRLGISLDPDTRLGDLTIAQQQLIEICKALIHEPRLLILDEPTSSLSEADSLTLFKVVHELRDRGVTILYISHRMREVFDNCDAVTVLRDGKHVRTARLADTSPDEVVRLMVGRDLAEVKRVRPEHAGKPVVLSVEGLGDDHRYRDVSFSLRQGEIVGLAGLIGAGRSEVAMGIFGAPPPKHGTVSIAGKPVKISRPRDAMRLGIALAPEDRKDQGLVLGMSVGSNLSLAALGLGRLSKGPVVRPMQEARLIDTYVGRFKIKTPTVEQLVRLLSGGNQQKVVLAKWLASRPRVLIVDEPTRGVDVTTKAEIYALMRELAHEGLAILVISSDLPEILTISDRILVMRAGQLVGEVGFDEASEERIMSLAALEHADPAHPEVKPTGFVS
ncbi:sugar ABC transporter ATP-binding protein [Caballeronia novacaledonica]|uniref:Sugar ABC transporter ATP-binding protein n=2 Tax=Caballeronia novacaledonica TaxID=1544861 RepID=A0AA37I9I0_9BURK|nr:sugar ABC transporter ATP-binding protein [Caballeronia novacaledonica]KAK45569.1 D-ribose transporter ATP-binding protein [Caballeronia jiangsuensis]GJH16797.1 sugar ABC transporter ATP-binding protein [Caballeronia novacaledonica]GJH24528.1 sugar ABC transporter ATP-binding protein [Caballeronia novacaledonica]